MTRFIAIVERKYDTWRMRIVLTILSVAAVVSLPGTAAAFDLEEALRSSHPQYQAPDEIRISQAGCKSLSDATAEVRQRTGGQIVGAETKVQGGREVHHIKVLKDGKVRVHKVSGCRR